ncbi:MAG: D-alanyl-D-alanine carboxypeptidase, partial [Lachnospiraceae bacterium]|nr:D-alanyl-D-alanine carboxypeptidase [Lachnospiraceae bacterium]
MKRVCSIIVVLALMCALAGCVSDRQTVDPTYFTSGYAQLHPVHEAYDSGFSFAGLPDSQKFLYQDICFSSVEIPNAQLADISAVSAACYDVDRAEVIYSKNIFEKVYPASTTKLLTAYVAARYTEPSDIVTIKKDNCGIEISGAQKTGFKAGDTITMEDLMYCLLMFSANDAAVAIAEHVSGSVDAFCKLMNSEAEAIGATGTH